MCKDSRFLNCYDAYSITSEGSVITLNTSESFNCLVYDYMEIDNITVSITTDYNVVDNNADVVDGNIYKWHINNSNYSNKPIKFSYDKSIKKNRFNLKIIFIVLICLFSVLMFFIFQCDNLYQHLIK